MSGGRGASWAPPMAGSGEPGEVGEGRRRSMEALFQDVRYGMRMLAKTPAFSAIAVLTLGVAIGTNTVVFSIVDALFVRPLPVAHPRELIGGVGKDDGISIPYYSYFRDRSAAFSQLAAHYSTAPVYMVGEGGSEPVEGAAVSANYFSVLGLEPALGRFFLPQDDSAPGRSPVTVISYGLWHGRFQSDPSNLGKRIKLNGTDFTIVGVAPRVFHGVYAGINNDLWIPLSMSQVAMTWCNTREHGCTFLDV